MPPPDRSLFSRLLLLGASSAVVLAGCGVEEIVLEPFRGETPHERYVEHLERSGLTESALARDWVRAAEEALESPVAVSPAMREEGWLPPEAPAALGYRLEMERGQRLRVGLELEEESDAVVFMEVFRVRGRPDVEDPTLLTVAWADSLARELVYDARATATFLVRVQPELLRGGAYRISLEVGPSLAFPVESGGVGNIRSRFGAPRDGGVREHHGVDIFAPRGTPVIAASEGQVSRVRTTPIGGKVVWVRSSDGDHSEYYAHLDAQLVEPRQRVARGDTLGLVGNTGNAITTPPHLHFGIYARGPVDPFPYLNDPGGPAPPLNVADDWFHTSARLGPDGATVRVGPSARSEPLAEAGAYLPVRVLAGSGDWARVRLPDRRQGYVSADRLEPADAAVAFERTRSGTVLRSDPRPDAPGFRSPPAGMEVAVIGRFGDWSLIRIEDGEPPGWIHNSEGLGEAASGVSTE